MDSLERNHAGSLSTPVLFVQNFYSCFDCVDLYIIRSMQMLLRFTSPNKANDHIYLPLLMEIRHSTVVYVHEKCILVALSRPFNTEEYQYDNFKTNSKETCFQQTTCIKWTRECPLNTGLTVNLWLQTNKLSLNIKKHTLLFLKLKRKQ